MEDKTPMYIMMMVGIVAIVAVVYMLTNSSSASTQTYVNGVSVTGNVVAGEDIAPIDFSGAGRVILAIVLAGTAVFMYRRSDVF